ncbi:MAG: acyltransferase [Candidatus Competibacteraceae bacterium]
MMHGVRTLPWDWHPGTLPDNALIDATAFIETSYSFLRYRSQAKVGFKMGYGAATYKSTMFDVGPHGQVQLGDYALVHGAWIICEAAVTIGNYTLISWNAVIMDSYRLPFDRAERRRLLERLPFVQPRLLSGAIPARPIHIDSNVWIGFDACVLPGVTIGEGSIVGARSVIAEDVAPYTVVAGNPARVIRHLAFTGNNDHAIQTAL